MWLLTDGIPFVERELVCRPRALGVVPISEVKWHKHVPRFDIADRCLRLYARPPRRDADPIALLDTQLRRVAGRDLYGRVGCGGLKLGSTTCLGPRVKLMHEPARGKHEGK